MKKFGWLRLVVSAAPLLGIHALVSSAGAATIDVNTLNTGFVDDGECGLREAIYAVYEQDYVLGCNPGDGVDDTITLPPGTYVVTESLPLFKSVRIQGSGDWNTVIDSQLTWENELLRIGTTEPAGTLAIADELSPAVGGNPLRRASTASPAETPLGTPRG